MARAWGKILAKAGLSGAGDAMSTALEDLGEILDNSISISTEDGRNYELRGTGGELLDSLRGEPSLTLNLTLVNIAKATPFWDTEEDEGETHVKSLVNNDKHSFSMQSKVVGSETFNVPYSTIAATPSYSEENGWTAVLAIRIMKGATGRLWSFGKVEA